MTTANTLYDERAAAAYLGGSEAPLSTRTLQRWRLEGFGPTYIKLGRLVRYRETDLDEFIHDRRFSSTSMHGVFGVSHDLQS